MKRALKLGVVGWGMLGFSALADKVHPNAAGAKKMADHWMEALLPLLEEGNAPLSE